MVMVAVALTAWSSAVDDAYSQKPQLATFQESAQLVIDRTFSGNITASITLQSTSNQEIIVPSGLVNDILDNPRIVSVILTNQEGCGVPGVADRGCILINILRAPEDTNIIKIQDAARAAGDSVIGDLNRLFDTDAAYHSSYIHHRDELNVLLGTSGTVSGRDVVSAVYAMPREDTYSMYQKIAALTVDRRIRDAGGFFTAAGTLAAGDVTHMSLSIIPCDEHPLFQLKVSSEYGGAANVSRVDPMDYFGIGKITRSDYFSNGFYPLNSVFQVVMLSPDVVKLRAAEADMIPTREVGGEWIPTEFGKSGWVFDSVEGVKIDGRYLFGTDVDAGDDGGLVLEFDPASSAGRQGGGSAATVTQDGVGVEEYVVIAIIIAVFAAAAAGFYLRGYRNR